MDKEEDEALDRLAEAYAASCEYPEGFCSCGYVTGKIEEATEVLAARAKRLGLRDRHGFPV